MLAQENLKTLEPAAGAGFDFDGNDPAIADDEIVDLGAAAFLTSGPVEKVAVFGAVAVAQQLLADELLGQGAFVSVEEAFFQNHPAGIHAAKMLHQADVQKEALEDLGRGVGAQWQSMGGCGPDRLHQQRLLEHLQDPFDLLDPGFGIEAAVFDLGSDLGGKGAEDPLHPEIL